MISRRATRHASLTYTEMLLKQSRLDVAAVIASRTDGNLNGFLASSLFDQVCKSVLSDDISHIAVWREIVTQSVGVDVVDVGLSIAFDAVMVAFATSLISPTIFGVPEMRAVLLGTKKSHAKANGQDRADRRDAAVGALVAVLRGRRDYLSDHALACERLALSFLHAYPLLAGDNDGVVLAALLHDIGMVIVPENSICDAGILSEQGWLCVQDHPQAGADMLAEIPQLAFLAPIVAAHHERVDGTGYPLGLRGDEITRETRVVAVVDAVCAMSGERSYRGSHPFAYISAELTRGAGGQWDGEIVNAMIALLSNDRAEIMRKEGILLDI